MKDRAPVWRAAQASLGLIIAGALLWVFFRQVDWPEVSSAARDATWWLLGLCALVSAASFVVRSHRWKLLLQPIIPSIAFIKAFRFFTIGFAVSMVVPGRPGEVLRPYMLARDQGKELAPVLATVVVERVLALVAVLLFLAIGLVVPGTLGDPEFQGELAGQAATAIRAVGLLATLAVALLCVFLFLLRARTAAARSAMTWLTSPLPSRLSSSIVRTVEAFAEGVRGLQGPREIARVLAWTGLSWLVLAGCLYSAMAAFGISAPLHHVLFLQAVLALGVAIPTPAGTGTYHAGVVGVVSGLWGHDGAQVAAFAITSHLVVYAPALILGVVSTLQEGISVLTRSEALPRQEASIKQ